MDVAAVHEAAGRALSVVRSGGGPVFLELRTYRFRAHSMFDPDLYRDESEIEAWKARDPITTFVTRLVGDGIIGETDVQALWDAAAAEMDDAIAFAEQGTSEPVEDLGRHVYRRERA